VNDISVLNVLADLFVLTATGARSALGRVPRGRAGHGKTVQLIEALGNLAIGQAVLVAIQRSFGDDIHAELTLIGTIRLIGDGLLTTTVAGVVVPVVLRDLDWSWFWNVFDDPRGDLLGVAELVTATWTRLQGEIDRFVRFWRTAKRWVVAWVAADRSAVGLEIVRVVGRRLGRARALFARWRVWILVASEAGFEAVDFFVFLFEFCAKTLVLRFEIVDSLLQRLHSLEKLFFGWFRRTHFQPPPIELGRKAGEETLSTPSDEEG